MRTIALINFEERTELLGLLNNTIDLINNNEIDRAINLLTEEIYNFFGSDDRAVDIVSNITLYETIAYLRTGDIESSIANILYSIDVINS